MKQGNEQVWRLQGYYLESCNCDIVCPCVVNGLGFGKVPATYGNCDLFQGFAIESGHYEDVDLKGLAFSAMIFSPGPGMALPNWSVAYYIDDTATEKQYEALARIISGEVGGPPAFYKALSEENLGVKKAKIKMSKDDSSVKVVVEDVAQADVKILKGLNDSEAMKITNCHPFTMDVIQGITRKMIYNDHGYSLHNDGKSGLYADFIWEDTCPIGVRG